MVMPFSFLIFYLIIYYKVEISTNDLDIETKKEE
jgi:hypothetical protein